MAVTEVFDSLAAFVDYANRDTDVPTGSRSSRDGSLRQWCGNASWSDALALASGGWRDGAERIERQRVSLAPHGMRSRRVAVMREVGPGTISMGNYLAGHPQPYVALVDDPSARPGKGKIVHIVVTLAISANVNTDVIETRGGAICALADALERAGRRVEITAVYANAPKHDQKDISEWRVRIKNAHERLNIATVAFALAHPAMYRRICFSALETMPEDFRRAHGVPGGYGSVVDASSEGADIYFGGMSGGNGNFRSAERAAAWVRAELVKQGVKVSD